MKCECGACKTCNRRQVMREHRARVRAFHVRELQRAKAIRKATVEPLDDLDRKAASIVLRPHESSGPLRSTWFLIEAMR